MKKYPPTYGATQNSIKIKNKNKEIKKMNTITLYNNYPDTTYFEEKRKDLYNKYAEIQFYDDENDVPYHFIKSEIDYENEVNYNNFIYQIQEIFKTTAFAIYGTCTTILGCCSGYTIIANFEEFERLINNCQNIKITLEENKIVIQCKHNQGTNFYNLRQLTQFGYDLANKNNFNIHTDDDFYFTGENISICPNIKKYNEEINF